MTTLIMILILIWVVHRTQIRKYSKLLSISTLKNLSIMPQMSKRFSHDSSSNSNTRYRNKHEDSYKCNTRHRYKRH